MKTDYVLACLLVLAAGCTSTERHASHPTEPTYAPEIISSAPDSVDADRALASVVRQQFDRYGALATLARNIQISARNGEVTLAGSVPGEQEKRMIHAMVKNTKGVLVVNDQLEVPAASGIPFSQSDRLVVNRVRQALKEQPTVAAYAPNLEISAESGVVTLAGNVASQTDRQIIETTARNTTGVASVIDRIQAPLEPTGRPDQPSRIYPSDAGEIFSLHVNGLTETDRTLAQRILQGLRTDTALSSLLPVVSINVADGKVTLRGTVQNDDQRRTIVSTVQRAAGSNNVFDELQVQQPR